MQKAIDAFAPRNQKSGDLPCCIEHSLYLHLLFKHATQMLAYFFLRSKSCRLAGMQTICNCPKGLCKLFWLDPCLFPENHTLIIETAFYFFKEGYPLERKCRNRLRRVRL